MKPSLSKLTSLEEGIYEFEQWLEDMSKAYPEEIFPPPCKEKEEEKPEAKGLFSSKKKDAEKTYCSPDRYSAAAARVIYKVVAKKFDHLVVHRVKLPRILRKIYDETTLHGRPKKVLATFDEIVEWQVHVTCSHSSSFNLPEIDAPKKELVLHGIPIVNDKGETWKIQMPKFVDRSDERPKWMDILEGKEKSINP